jgi:Fe-S oxidoreductase
MIKGELKDYATTFATCWKCRLCEYGEPVRKRICPSVERYGFFAYTGGGKCYIGRSLLDGTISYSKDLADVLYKCTTCGACSIYCRNEFYISNEFIDQVKLTEYLRSRVFKAGFGLKRHVEMVESAKKEHNPFGEPHGKRMGWLKEKMEDAKTAFFVGCTSSYREPKIPLSLLRIMKGKDFIILPDEWCCGSPFLRIGCRELAEELANHNVEVLENSGIEEIMVHCPGCYMTFKEDYRDLTGKLPFKPIHSLQVIHEMVKNGKVKFKRKEIKVTYHDPCHLGRGCKIYDEPREILRFIPGVEIIEMERSREDAWCCGAGGGVRSGFPDFAGWTAVERMREARRTGADMLLTSCPLCKINLRDTKMMEVMDILEFLETLKLKT